MKENNIYFEAVGLVQFDQLKADYDVASWMHIKINDLSLRGEDTRYSDDGVLRFKTTFTDHNGANRTFSYAPGIVLPLSPCKNGRGRYDLRGIYVEVMWSESVNWFLVFINIPGIGASVYRGIAEASRAKRPNGMSVYINRVGVAA